MTREYKFGFTITGDGEGGKKALKAVREEVEKLDQQQKKAGQSTDGMRKQMEDLIGKTFSLKGAAAALGGTLAAAFSVNYFATLIKSSIDAADHLNDLSKSTGLNVRELAGLQLAAKQTGGELDGTAKAINMLSKNMGANEEKFRKLGITAKEPLEAFKQLSDLFVGISDHQERAALAASALGRSWESVVPLLAEGSANIQAMVDKGARLSGITQEMAERSDAFNDNVETLKMTMGGWANEMTNSLLPSLVYLTEHMDDIGEYAKVGAAALAGQYVAAAITATGATATLNTALVALRTSLIALSGPGAIIFMTGIALNELVQSAKAAAEENAKLATSFDPLLAKLGQLTEKQLVKNIMAIDEQLEITRELIKEKENEVKALQDGGHGYQHAARELDSLNVRMKAQISNQALLTSQLRRVQEGWKFAAEASAEAGKEVESFTRAHVGAYETVTMNTDALRELYKQLDLTTAGYADAAKPIEKTGDVAQATGDKFYDLTLRNKSYTATIADDWENAASRIARTLAELMVYGTDSLSYLGKSMASGALQGGLTNILGGGGGSSLLGSVLNGATGAMGIGSLIGGSPLLSSMGILTGGQAAALNLPASAAFGGSAMGMIGAAAPWIAGALALAAIFDKKSTPSFNAGFLTQSVPGAKPDQLFSTAAFASGLNPVGFSRRSSQAEAEQTIELFRQIDKLIVDTAALGGLRVNAGALSGYSETGLGSGVFFGAAGESGRPGTALDQQLNLFASQLIGSLRGQLDDATLEGILSGGSIDAMLGKLKETVTLQQEAADAANAVAQAQADAAAEQLAALGGLRVNAAALSGYSETGLGSGVFFGAAGESGRPGTALDQQLNVFATQLIGSLRGQLDDATLEGILSGGSIDAMLGKLKEAVTLQQEAADAANTVAQAQADAAAEQLAALDRFQAALGSARSYIDGIAQAQQELLVEQRRLIEDQFRERIRQEEELHGRRVSLFRSLQDTITGYRLGDLSTLNPRDQLSLAQSNFRSLAGMASNTSLSMADRVAAAEQLQGASESYLRAGRSYFASSGGYKDIFSEVLGTLEGARFLGASGKFDASPIENAMLAELQKLNESVMKLPDGMARALMPVMANLINQGLLAGKSKEFLANTITGLGADAVAGADMYLESLGAGSISGFATSPTTIRDYVAALNTDATREADVVAAVVAKAKEYGLSASTVGSALGLSSAETQDVLKRYGFPMFEAGTNYVPRDMLAYVHQGERIIPRADNANMTASLGAVVSRLETLTAEVVNLRQWQQSADQSKVSALQQIATSNEALNRRDDSRQNLKVGGATV